MRDIWVADLGLEALARQARRVAVDVERSQAESEAVVRHDTGLVGAAHRALSNRWFAGLRCGEAATTQLADEILRCAWAYQQQDAEQSVVFVGLTR